MSFAFQSAKAPGEYQLILADVLKGTNFAHDSVVWQPMPCLHAALETRLHEAKQAHALAMWGLLVCVRRAPTPRRHNGV